MKYIPGQPRPAGSGRGKGTKNVKRMPGIVAHLVENDIHPLAEILRIIPKLEPIDQAKIWMDLLSYCEAKPRFVEQDDSEHTEESDAALLQLFKDVPSEKIIEMIQSEEAEDS